MSANKPCPLCSRLGRACSRCAPALCVSGPVSIAISRTETLPNATLVGLARRLGLGECVDRDVTVDGKRVHSHRWLFTPEEVALATAERLRRQRVNESRRRTQRARPTLDEEHGHSGGTPAARVARLAQTTPRREQRAAEYAAVLESEGWTREDAEARARAAYELGPARRLGVELRLSPEWRRACREHAANSRGTVDNYPLGEVR